VDGQHHHHHHRMATTNEKVPSRNLSFHPCSLRHLGLSHSSVPQCAFAYSNARACMYAYEGEMRLHSRATSAISTFSGTGPFGS
jgi:hypothetical protein